MRCLMSVSVHYLDNAMQFFPGMYVQAMHESTRPKDHKADWLT